MGLVDGGLGVEALPGLMWRARLALRRWPALRGGFAGLTCLLLLLFAVARLLLRCMSLNCLLTGAWPQRATQNGCPTGNLADGPPGQTREAVFLGHPEMGLLSWASEQKAMIY